ncbi:hypothetical protein DITRI_Ditri04bG0192200 [Diplodiscus trichospermus]
MVNPEVMESFWPWMLVSHKNRKVDKRHDIRGGGYIENEEMGLDNNEQLEKVNVAHATSVKLMGKGKKPDVQISEKEILNSHPKEAGSKDKQILTENNEVKGVRNSLLYSKQAGAEEEHIVVQGSNNGKSNVRKVVNNRGIDKSNSNTSSLMILRGAKHHQDSPQVLQNHWEIKIVHAYRESNRAADMLASAAIQHNQGLQVLENPFPGLGQILLKDAVGVKGLCFEKLNCYLLGIPPP